NNSNMGIPPRQSSCQKSTSGELDLIFHKAVAYAEYSLHPFKPLGKDKKDKKKQKQSKTDKKRKRQEKGVKN
ncbi:hypothetical protein Tco_0094866, partial [Tanacetum coccineum]